MTKAMLIAAGLAACLAIAIPATGVGATDAGVAKSRNTVNRVIRDCAQDGKLNRHYSKRLLRRALRKLPSDLDEYTDCRHVIKRALHKHKRKRRR